MLHKFSFGFNSGEFANQFIFKGQQSLISAGTP